MRVVTRALARKQVTKVNDESHDEGSLVEAAVVYERPNVSDADDNQKEKFQWLLKKFPISHYFDSCYRSSLVTQKFRNFVSSHLMNTKWMLYPEVTL